jgi:hypothetical protein
MLSGLSDKQIIKLLEEHSLWRKRACREILSRKDDFIPMLLDILDQTIKEPESFEYDVQDQYIAAAMLLANMREPKAYPKLVSLISYDENDINYLWDDLIIDSYAPLLRDTYNGDKSLLPPLMENRSISPWSRITAIEAWALHNFDGYISREEMSECFRRLIHEVYAGQPDDDDITVLSSLASCVRSYQIGELLTDVKSLFDRNCINEAYLGDYNKYIEWFNNTKYGLFDVHIDDPIALMDRWGLFQDNSSYEDEDLDVYSKKDDDDYYDYDIEDDEDDEDDLFEKPHRVISIGRNEPCPCGSGKKYKNCCMEKQ